jgi:pimeloyl-ACP methyl ester carboxylesterase
VSDPDIVESGFADELISLQGGAVHLLRGGSGPPLLYLHGGGAAGRWRRFHELLAERFEVYAPDHPGFGRSDGRADVDSVDDLARHYLALLDRLELERATLVGASFGGWISCELALLAPERVSRLVLLASIGLALPDHPITPLFPRPRREALGMLFHDQELAYRYSHGTEFGAVLGSEPDGAALGGYLAAGAGAQLAPRLVELSLPTLVIWGDDDQVVPLAHGEHFAAHLPDARLKVIPACGHGLPFEAPETVAASITTSAGQ